MAGSARSDTPLESRIDRVTLFRNGALVVRVADVLPDIPWPADLLLPGLPLLFRQETLRVRVVPTEGSRASLRLGPVEEEALLGHARESRGPDPEAIRASEGRLRRLQAEQASRNEISSWYAGIQLPTELDLPRRAPATHPDITAWSALTELVRGGQDRCAEIAEDLRHRIRDETEHLEALRRRKRSDHADAETRPARYTRTLRVRGEASDALPPGTRLEIEYFMPGARWVPTYDLFVDDKAGTSELVLHAQVAQATGEDWNGVAVTVSTADLRRETRLPDLASWRIGRASPPPPPAWRPLPTDTDTLFAGLDEAVPVPTQGAVAKDDMDDGIVEDAPADRRRHAVSAPTTSRRPSPRSGPPAQAGRAPGGAGAASQAMPCPPPAPCVVADTACFGAIPAPEPMPVMEKARMAPPQAKRSSVPMLGGALSSLSDALSVDEECEEKAEAPCPPPFEMPASDPSQLLDYAWLRLAPWTDHWRRGRLLPVDAMTDLRAIVEERGGDASLYSEMEKAVRALTEARQRMSNAPLPEGCSPISASFFFRYPQGPRVDIPSDGRFHQVRVVSGVRPCRTVYRVVPKQDATVFRTAVAENPLRMPLLAGPMRVHLDGAYLVTGRLEEIGAGGTLHLGLGVEDRIRVARNTTFNEAEKGMIGSSAILTHQVRTEVRSMLPGPARIEVFERLPLAEGVPDVSVEPDLPAPRPARDVAPDGTPLKGALRWDLDVLPNTRVEIQWSYVVKLPSKKELVGGNRREH